VPVAVFAINTVLNLIDSGVVEQDDNATEYVDEGETKVPFPCELGVAGSTAVFVLVLVVSWVVRCGLWLL